MTEGEWQVCDDAGAMLDALWQQHGVSPANIDLRFGGDMRGSAHSKTAWPISIGHSIGTTWPRAGASGNCCPRKRAGAGLNSRSSFSPVRSPEKNSASTIGMSKGRPFVLTTTPTRRPSTAGSRKSARSPRPNCGRCSTRPRSCVRSSRERCSCGRPTSWITR